ncbi:hypothetical protein [Flavobacterium psychrotolerans]|uniref:Magnesium and cobalt transport protein CorA n=1 Tax=Flavobacterium psychrotolerans TaxID=2169410 RepID=A0A2U1JP90_9FLAO|nr:hypothetical protein [Flavobacterium psychrotolerans]PWA06779.1 hypothetical protein DB895_01985 [Flavobacterium psychrotolerans]
MCYNINDKRRLYWLLDEYLLTKINESTFSDEFHNTFVNELDYNDFKEIEYSIFFELSNISEKFSPYEEDHKLWSGFTTVEELKKKIVETKEKLKSLNFLDK